MADKLDAHYLAITEDNNRLQVTVFGVPPPAKQWMEFGTFGKPLRAELVSVHTAYHDSDDDDDDTSGCFPDDPEYDDED